jgi:biotin carboxyl carrier protein
MIKKLRVTVDGKQYEVTVELDDEGAGVSQAGPLALPPISSAVTTAPVAVPPSAPESPGAPGDPGDVPSPLAGRVTAINVEPGQEVKEGDHLLTLEAMKMNTFVMAPRAGKVKEVKVSVGSAVEERQPLVTLE